MKPALLICVSVAASVATSMIIAATSSTRSAETVEAVEPDPELARLRESLAAVQRDHDALRHTLDDLRAQSAARAEPQSRVPIGEIEAAVARALEARGNHQEGPPRGSEKAPAVAVQEAFDARAAFAELVAPGLSWDDAQTKWKAIVEAGQLDAVVAMFEKRAADRPNDPEAQVDLGKAYLQKVFKAGGGPEAGIWATKADRSFDQALTLDDHNWEARFNKAVSLSFWPPVFGKQTEAIKHFELLVAQQEGQPARAAYSETHVLLGNLYQQLGNREKALATWKHGLELFPGNPELEDQIANAGDN